jgi:hypothetical protein
MRKFLPILLLAALPSGGCGQSNSTSPDSGGGGGGGGDGPSAASEDLLSSGSGDMASSIAGYPAGPYGDKVGDTFPPLLWEGYVNDAADAISNTKPFGTYSMDAVRKSGRTYAMIHVSEFT